ncbi:MAG: NAD-dependent epimerase/dehydratase family protein [Anaerolineae bacterium]|nr:NAD-dependent epimerase/dehydratase family protein [Anaerolineae bacterium]
MKKALVCGAGGFIGGHLVKKLKREGYRVRGVDIKEHEFAPTQADEFVVLDLRESHNAWQALSVDGGTFDEVYQLAADMGGMGFIHSAECEIMHNSALINVHMIDTAARIGVPRYFFSSSVCVYRDMMPGEPALAETDAVPANPDNEYGWEKLYAERTAQAYSRHYPIEVRIARFENCYGPEGTWRGGREKAPAALCRKVAEAPDGGAIEVWGDGTAIRNYTYVDDMVDAIYRLTQSDLEGAVNLGGDEYVTVEELARTVIAFSGKQLGISYVEGPVGVHARNFSKERSASLNWKAQVDLKEGIARTYPWIAEQVRQARAVSERS